MSGIQAKTFLCQESSWISMKMLSTRNSRKAPVGLSWVLNNLTNDFDHQAFFNGYTKMKTADRYRLILNYWIEDVEVAEALKIKYGNWKRTAEAKAYWRARATAATTSIDDATIDTATIDTTTIDTATTTATTSNTVESQAIEMLSVILNEIEKKENCFVGSINLSGVVKQIFQFSLNYLNTGRLSLESHTPQLLCFLSILLLTKTPTYHTGVLSSNANETRSQLLSQLGMFSRKFPRGPLMGLLDIIKEVQSGRITRLDAVRRMDQDLPELDQFSQKLVKYSKRAVEELPFESFSTEILETKLCSRYLLTIFRSVFEGIEDRELPVDFDFTGTSTEESGEEELNITKKRPDGVFRVASRSVGFVEAKPLCQAKSLQKINLDLYRLGIFCKSAIQANNLKKTMAVQAVGTNITFYIVENHGSICTMTEIWSQRFPMAVTELPSLLGFFDEFLDVATVFYEHCVHENELFTDNHQFPAIRSPTFKAITC